MPYNSENYLNKVREIQDFARQYYEPGRQDRSWRWVWRVHVKNRYHISFTTFKRYMKIRLNEK